MHRWHGFTSRSARCGRQSLCRGGHNLLSTHFLPFPIRAIHSYKRTYATRRKCHDRSRKFTGRNRPVGRKTSAGQGLDHPSVHRSGRQRRTGTGHLTVRWARAACRPAWTGQDKIGRNLGSGNGFGWKTGAVYSRFDASRYPRFGSIRSR